MIGRIVKRFVSTSAEERLSKRHPMKNPILVPTPVPIISTSMNTKNCSTVLSRPVVQYTTVASAIGIITWRGISTIVFERKYGAGEYDLFAYSLKKIGLSTMNGYRVD